MQPDWQQNKHSSNLASQMAQLDLPPLPLSTSTDQQTPGTESKLKNETRTGRRGHSPLNQLGLRYENRHLTTDDRKDRSRSEALNTIDKDLNAESSSRICVVENYLQIGLPELPEEYRTIAEIENRKIEHQSPATQIQTTEKSPSTARRRPDYRHSLAIVRNVLCGYSPQEIDQLLQNCVHSERNFLIKSLVE